MWGGGACVAHRTVVLSQQDEGACVAHRTCCAISAGRGRLRRPSYLLCCLSRTRATQASFSITSQPPPLRNGAEPKKGAIMRSDQIKLGFERAPHRGLLRATGVVGENDFNKPFIAVCNSYVDVV